MSNLITEKYGTIFKEENLWCQSDSAISNTCVLESLEPYPGYYGNFPHEVKPSFIYLITKQKYDNEKIYRASRKVKQKLMELNLDIATSEISFFDELLFSIRLGNIKEYSSVKSVQECYMEHGIEFHRKKHPIENITALIKTSKFFKLNEFAQEGIYLDMIQANNGYFKIPNYVDWADFKKIIFHIKNNNRDLRFDAATGFFYDFSDVVDFVRIYMVNLQLTGLKRIRDTFLREL